MRIIFLFCLILSLKGNANTISITQLETIYTKIKQARGEIRNDFPTLDISHETTSMASYSPREKILRVENKAIKSCQKFGTSTETALAFIIGHELTHFYQNHGGDFAFFMSQSIYNSNIKKEEQADIYGAMLAYWAGYLSLIHI